jgi:hypothetical protein
VNQRCATRSNIESVAPVYRNAPFVGKAEFFEFASLGRGRDQELNQQTLLGALLFKQACGTIGPEQNALWPRK